LLAAGVAQSECVWRSLGDTHRVGDRGAGEQAGLRHADRGVVVQ
jgi:hypothetical protein